MNSGNTTMSTDVTRKPGRPFGLSLAILVSVLLFSLLPFLQILLDLQVQARLQRLEELSLPIDGEDVQPIFAGGDYGFFAPEHLVIQGLLGFVFLVIAVMAWRGRPAWMRYVLFWTVIGLTALNVVLILIPLLTPANIEQGLDSGQSIAQTLRCGQLFFTILIPLYVVWYMNRAPARAFYRGYYLSEENDESEA